MAKKKNISKKHRFKHVESASAEPAAAAYGAAASAEPRTTRAVAPVLPTRDFSYVGGDVRRIGIMASVLVALELVLYYALAHSSLGTVINQFIKI